MASNRLTAAQVLELMVNGHGMATRLKAIRQDASSSAAEAMAEGRGLESAALLDEIVRTFELLLLNESVDDHVMPDSGDHDSVTGHVLSPGSETSGEKKRNFTGDDRRGSCRRQRKQPIRCEKVFDEKFNDGHIWRKYGQKQIQGYMYPRSYYRCTHRNTQGCLANKQVQKADDNQTYIISYIGDHTCKELPKTSDVDQLMPSSPMDESNMMISFEKQINNKDKNLLPPHSSSWPPQKLHYQDFTPISSSADLSALGAFHGSSQLFSGNPGASNYVGDCSGFNSSSESIDHVSFLAGSMGLNDDELFNFDQDGFF